VKKYLLFIISFFAIPFLASAQDQLVSCGGLDCSVCSILETVSLVFNWLLGVIFSVALLFVIIGGFMYTGSVGREDKMHKARKLINYSLFGFFIILISFLATHSVFYLLGAENKGSWYRFECSENYYGSEVTYVPEKEDMQRSLSSVNSLGQLIHTGDKAIVLDLKNLDVDNLMQDLLSMETMTRLKFSVTEEDVNLEDIYDLRKLDGGYIEKFVEPEGVFEKLDPSIENSFEEIITIDKYEGDIEISGKNEYGEYSDIYSYDDPELKEKFREIFSQLADQGIDKIIVYETAETTDEMAACIDSEGDWVMFPNECSAKKEFCGKESLTCSDKENITEGCVCPENTCLVNNQCVGDTPDFSLDGDEDGDGVINKYDQFWGTPKGEVIDDDPNSIYYGGSCSQIPLLEQQCSPTRCEDNDLVTYPPSGKDTCTENYESGITVEKYDCAYIDIEENHPKCVGERKTDNYWDDGESSQDDSGTKDESSKTNGSSNNTGGNTSQSGNNTGGTSTGNDTGTGDPGQLPPDLGPGNYNPTPKFEDLLECIGFKKGEIPYNGVLVTLLNPEDPTNEKHPRYNVSRMFYLTREGKVVGNAGQYDGEGLKVGPWTKGSGGSAWTPGWKIFRANTIHKSDRCSFRSGQGHRVGPKGEGMRDNGKIGGNSPVDMSGCNMHSGYRSSHSRGCMTMGKEGVRCPFTNKVKKMATGGGKDDRILMAVLPAHDSSGKIDSKYCGNMNPYAAVNKFKTLKQYKNYNPNSGYGSGDSRNVSQ